MPWRFAISRRSPGSYGLFRHRRDRRAGSTQPWYYFWGIWVLAKNIPAAKSLLAHLATREVQEQFVKASSGFDIPSFESFMGFKTWRKSSHRNTLSTTFHHEEDAIPHLAGYPAPLRIGTQMWAQAIMMKMIAQHTQAGRSANDAIAWAQFELESYMRT